MDINVAIKRSFKLEIVNPRGDFEIVPLDTKNLVRNNFYEYSNIHILKNNIKNTY